MALAFEEEPWTRIGSDLFSHEGKDYLIVVDHTSRWIDFRVLPDTLAPTIIDALSGIFAMQGIPKVVVSDNGPQYANKRFRKFAEEWGFTHLTSSPEHPIGNGGAERAVQTAKNIIKKNANQHLGLLAYRAAPLLNGYSPSEILNSRRLRTKLPMGPQPRKVDVDRELIAQREERYRDKYTERKDQDPKVIKLPVLEKGDRVYIRDPYTGKYKSAMQIQGRI